MEHKELINYAREFVEKFVKEPEFIDMLSCDGDAYDAMEIGDSILNHKGFDHFCLAAGMTKVVIIPDEFDYVIKVPRFGATMNYCSIECDVYEKACDANLGDYFAECFYGGEVSINDFDKIPFYLMEKVDCDENRVSEECKENTGSYSTDSDNIKDFIYNIYGDEVGNDLYDFFNDFGINDLHGGNIGYRDDTIVFVDYSGFHD